MARPNDAVEALVQAIVDLLWPAIEERLKAQRDALFAEMVEAWQQARGPAGGR